MNKIKLPNIRAAFEEKIMSDLFDESLNGDYQESVSFTVEEIRAVVNCLTGAVCALRDIQEYGLADKLESLYNG